MLKSWLKTHPKIFKLTFYYASIKLVLFFLGWLLSLDFMHLVSLEKMASSDLCLNDLFYTVKNNSEDQNKDVLSGKVIFLNTGGLTSDSFRADLAKVLTEVNKFQPACIGVDMYFSSDTSIPGTGVLMDVLNSTPNLVMGERAEKAGGKADKRMSTKAVYGNISFPEKQVSIRRYASDSNTFAFKLAQKLNPANPVKPFARNNFVIHYLSDKVITKEQLWDSRSGQLSQSGFLQMEASELIQGDSTTLAMLLEMAKGKIIIVGHLGPPGNSVNDVEDKHRVPTDSNLVNRDRTMYGALIHANAIENWLNPAIRFSVWSDTALFKWLVELLLFLFLAYIIFAHFGKVINITLLTLLSIPVAFMVMFLMKSHIYLEMGLTMIHFILFEELYKILKPLYQKVELWLEK